MPRQRAQQERLVTADYMNEMFDDSLSAYESDADRDDAYRPAITSLTDPFVGEVAPAQIGQQSVVPTSYDVYNGQSWVPWRRVLAGESGLVQVSINNASITESADETAFCIFQVTLQDGAGIPLRLSEGRLGILGTKIVRVNYATTEYDSRPRGQRVGLNVDREAVSGQDFQPTAGTLVWDENSTSATQTILVPILHDEDAEPDERFLVQLTPISNVRLVGSGEGIGIITNLRVPILTVDDITINPSEEDVDPDDPNIYTERTTAPVNIRLNNAGTVDVNATYRVFTDTNANPRQTATEGVDYIASENTGPITIPAGRISPRPPIVLRIPRQVQETSETFTLEITPNAPTGPGGRPIIQAIYAKRRAIVTIVGRSVLPTVFAENRAYGPGFGGGSPSSVSVPVRLIPATTSSNGDVTVRWQTVNNSPLARVGHHFIANSGTLRFRPGETEKSITIQVPWDYRYDSTASEAFRRIETANVDIRLVPSNNADRTRSSSTVRIELGGIETARPTTSITVTSANAEAIKGNTITFPVNIPTSPGVTCSVDYVIRTGETHGTAEQDVDFTVPSGNRLTWGAGVSNLRRNIRVPTLNNPANTAGKTFTVLFSNPINCVISTNSVTGTILPIARTLPEISLPPSITFAEPTGSQIVSIPLTISPCGRRWRAGGRIGGASTRDGIERRAERHSLRDHFSACEARNRLDVVQSDRAKLQ